MKSNESFFFCIAVLLCCSSLAFAGVDSKVIDNKVIRENSSSDFKKPIWLKDIGVNVKESFDSNVYYVNQGQMANTEAFVTTITPRVSVDIAPLIAPDNTALQTFALSYTPQMQLFNDEGISKTEDNTSHKLTTQIKGKQDWFSYNLENMFNYVDGDRYGLTYSVPRISAWSTTLVRGRREQIQDEAKGSFKFDINESFFFRPTASLVYNDFMTVHKNAAVNPGYQNYIDRYEVVGGADGGYNITKDFAVTFGYRHGHQGQDRPSFSAQDSSNDFDRVLVGLEGKPLKWLKLDVQAGPDFRDYTLNSSNYRKGLTRLFAVGSATAEVTAKDKIRVGVKQFEWLSSTSSASYENKMYEIAYTRKITESLTGEVGARSWNLDYEANTSINSNREDILNTFYGTLTYVIDANWSVDANYTFDRSENNAEGTTVGGGEFVHHVATIGVNYKF